MTDMRGAFVAATTDLLADDPRTALVLADISESAFAVAAARHPDRVINVGIREQLLLGVTGGLALTGMRPIAHSYAPFLVERAFEQVKLDLGHQGVGGVLVSVGASYDVSAGGRTHQAPGDVALLDTLPDWAVHVPGHPAEVAPLLRAAARTDDRVYVRLSARGNAAAHPAEFHVVRPGGPTLVLAVGPILDAVLTATDGLDVTVGYAATIRPFPGDAVRTLATAGDVVLVEPYLAGTSAHEVDAVLVDVPHRVLALGVPRVELRRYGTPADHDVAYGLDPAGLRSRISAFVR